ncbi:MAG: TonB-dependent receptor plug domain-containing protein [Erythrobacter sp.]
MFRISLASIAACASPGILHAQDAGSEEQIAAEARQSIEANGGQAYNPEYFAQFAPRTALDMIEQVPGFQVSGGGGGGNGGRGLGQANQNVLVNGERLSSKSDSAQDQLRRIPASDVIRIEIVDGTSLDVPGLSGQVANVIVDLKGIAGTFSWKGRYRETAGEAEWFGGEISVAGTTGDLNFTVAIDNPNNRFGSDGPTFIRDASGNLIETEEVTFRGKFDKPTISANLGYNFSKNVSATLNLSYARSYFRRGADEISTGPLIDTNLRTNRFRENGYEYEIGGDFTFPVGAGSLKLIGLERFDSEDAAQTVIDDFDDPALDTVGSRFTRIDGVGERIGRAEYSFPFIGAEWQIAGEAAFNRLDRVSGLFEMDTSGNFIELDFPEGTGGVTEDRYDVSASVSKSITPRLSFQATGGYEFSTLKQTGSAANNRSFKRPKGSASLSWNNGKGLDITLTGERRVGQLSFGDFLARVNVDDNNGSAGNNELVPSQTWEAQVEINKTLGAWGSTSLMFEQRWIEDFVTLVPLDDLSDEANGNIPSARRTEIEWTSTLKLDPLGWRGAQLDLRLEYEEGEFRDPLTGELRDFSRGRDREADIELRHDIPGTDIAYGAAANYGRDRVFFRLDEFNLNVDGPTFARVYIEHKDLFGLTARATLGNLVNGRDRDNRTVFDGPRNISPILFTEERARRIGPIFRLDVSGNF